MDSTLWNYREPSSDAIIGFQVEATDGHIGAIDRSTHEVDNSYVVVDTGFWIFGKKRLLPAGVIDRFDTESKTVFVNLTRDQVREAPDLDTADDDGADGADRADGAGAGPDRDLLMERIGSYFGPYSWR